MSSKLRGRNAQGRTHTSEIVRKMAVFAMFGSLMFVSKLLMEFVPNVHFLGALIVVCTIVYRTQALIPLYLYVMLQGVFSGFALWWIPYLYVWTLLWGMAMLVPKRMSFKKRVPIYIAINCLHGLFFGVLYAPVQALLFGMNVEGMLAWIAAGFTFDILHLFGNLASGFLIYPLAVVLDRLESRFTGKRMIVK